jgi:hypothetical protein
MNMALEAAIRKWTDEAEWFEAQAKKFARSRKYDKATKARLIADYRGGARSAKAEVQRLQAEKARLDSLRALNEMFGP